jgi:hypothetical protein
MKPLLIALFVSLPFLISQATASEIRAEALKQALADKSFQLAGDKMAASFAKNGLALSDSEEIARAGFLEISSCLVDAALAQAEVESVPVEKVLDAIEVSISELDATTTDDRLTRGLLDENALGEKATPCLLEVAQQMGVTAE